MGKTRIRLAKSIVGKLAVGSLALGVFVPIVTDSVSAEVVTVPSNGSGYQSTNGYGLIIKPLLMDKKGVQINPRGGSYGVTQVEEYLASGESKKITASESKIKLEPSEENKVNISGDGVYQVKQTDRVPGYLLDDKSYQYVFPLVVAGVVASNQSVEFNPKLTPVIGQIGVTKVGNDEETPLSGATFTLHRLSNKSTGDTNINELVGELTTGNDGKITFGNLTEGVYRLVETGVPEGYVMDNRPIDFEVTVDATGKSVEVNAINDRHNLEENNTIINYTQGDLNNRVKTDYTSEGSIHQKDVQKVSTNGRAEYNVNVGIPSNILEYKTFGITTTLPEELVLVGDSVKIQAINSEGESELVDSSFYQIDGNRLTFELKPSTGLTSNRSVQVVSLVSVNIEDYRFLEDIERFEVEFEGEIVTEKVSAEDIIGNTVTISWDNGFGGVGSLEDVVNVVIKEGALEINKVDDSDELVLLEGAEFRIYKLGEGDNSITHNNDSYIPEINPRTGEEYVGLTDSEGELLFESLPFGEYLLVETQAPDGYKLTNKPIEFEIQDTETNHISEVEDSIGINITNKKERATLAEIIGIGDAKATGDASSNGTDTDDKDSGISGIFPSTGTAGLLISAFIVVGSTAGAIYLQTREEDEEESE